MVVGGGARKRRSAQIGGSMSRRIERVHSLLHVHGILLRAKRDAEVAVVRARGRLISKAIVCKSSGNFVTAAISVIKRTSVSPFARATRLFPTGSPLLAEKKIISRNQ